MVAGRRSLISAPCSGRRIRWLRQPDVEVEIVGVARAVRHRGAGIVPRETVYRPHWQYARASMYLAVRTRQDASGAASALRAAVASVDPSQPVADRDPLLGRKDGHPKLSLLDAHDGG